MNEGVPHHNREELRGNMAKEMSSWSRIDDVDLSLLWRLIPITLEPEERVSYSSRLKEWHEMLKGKAVEDDSQKQQNLDIFIRITKADAWTQTEGQSKPEVVYVVVPVQQQHHQEQQELPMQYQEQLELRKHYEQQKQHQNQWEQMPLMACQNQSQSKPPMQQNQQNEVYGKTDELSKQQLRNEDFQRVWYFKQQPKMNFNEGSDSHDHPKEIPTTDRSERQFQAYRQQNCRATSSSLDIKDPRKRTKDKQQIQQHQQFFYNSVIIPSTGNHAQSAGLQHRGHQHQLRHLPYFPQQLQLSQKHCDYLANQSQQQNYHKSEHVPNPTIENALFDPSKSYTDPAPSFCSAPEQSSVERQTIMKMTRSMGWMERKLQRYMEILETKNADKMQHDHSEGILQSSSTSTLTNRQRQGQRPFQEKQSQQQDCHNPRHGKNPDSEDKLSENSKSFKDLSPATCSNTVQPSVERQTKTKTRGSIESRIRKLQKLYERLKAKKSDLMPHDNADGILHSSSTSTLTSNQRHIQRPFQEKQSHQQNYHSPQHDQNPTSENAIFDLSKSLLDLTPQICSSTGQQSSVESRTVKRGRPGQGARQRHLEKFKEKEKAKKAMKMLQDHSEEILLSSSTPTLIASNQQHSQRPFQEEKLLQGHYNNPQHDQNPTREIIPFDHSKSPTDLSPPISSNAVQSSFATSGQDAPKREFPDLRELIETKRMNKMQVDPFDELLFSSSTSFLTALEPESP